MQANTGQLIFLLNWTLTFSVISVVGLNDYGQSDHFDQLLVSIGVYSLGLSESLAKMLVTSVHLCERWCTVCMLTLMDFYGADVGQFTSAAMFLFVCFGRVLFRTAVFGVFSASWLLKSISEKWMMMIHFEAWVWQTFEFCCISLNVVLLVQDTSERLWLSHAGMQSEEPLICFLLCILLAEHRF